MSPRLFAFCSLISVDGIKAIPLIMAGEGLFSHGAEGTEARG